jgi:hypothetical protein
MCGPCFQGFAAFAVDRGASLPRRHILSAAGALAAALLLAAPPQAGAQEDGRRPLRGSLGLQDGWEPVVSPVAPIGATPALDDPLAPLEEGIGGLDESRPPAQRTLPLGGIGDEPLETEDTEEIEEEEIVFPAEGIGITPPARPTPASRQIHSALLPEPHDLDPYLPIGIRIGSFLIFPEVEVGADMTNNVLATRFDARSDIGPEVTPRIQVNSDWSRHFLSFEANADRVWFSEFEIADVKNYQILSRGRLDVTGRTRLYAEVEKSQVQEGPSSIAITDIATAENTKLEEQHATAELEHTFNRLTLRLTGTVADFNYSDIGDTPISGPVPLADIRDYTETLGILRSTYEFQSNWAGFIETSINERDYREPLTVAGFRRGSMGWTVLGGVNLRLWGTLFGEIGVGWGEQQPIDDNFATVSGPLVNGNLIWMATPTTKFEFIARSDIAETTLEDSAGAVDNFFQLSLQKAFWRYLVLGVYGSYEIADFAGSSQVDQRTKVGATGEYYFNPVLSAYVRYEHTDFSSTPDPSGDFVEDEVKIGIKLRR